MTWVGSEKPNAFFALSAHAFLTKPMEQQEGYTVLYLSEEGAKDDFAEGKGVDRAEDRFVLWEIF